MTLNLKEAREKAGYTIDEVSSALKIRKQYLISLEEGNLSDIPGQIYVEGYTRMYCEFLDLEVPRSQKHAIKNHVASVSVPKPYKIYVATSAIIILFLIIALYLVIIE